MKKIIIWFCLFSKRYLKKMSFLVLLILLPLISIGLGAIESEENQGTRIALYSEEDGIARDIIESLLAYEGYFTFYESTSKENLINDVKTRKAECGYVFFQGMEEEISNGKVKGQIGVYIAPSTVLNSVSQEVVYSKFMEIYGRITVETFIDTDVMFAEMDLDKVKNEIITSYEEIKNSDGVYTFEYQQLNTVLEDSDFEDISIFPVRGIIAVYIFAVGLFSAVNCLKDKEEGIFGLVSYEFEPCANLIAIGTPVFWVGISAFLALLASGITLPLYFEMIVLSVYMLAVILLCDILKSLFKSGIQLCSIIPVVIIGALIFCPIFIDLTGILPVFNVLQKIWLPYFYLYIFIGSSRWSIVSLFLILLVLMVLNSVTRYLKGK